MWDEMAVGAISAVNCFDGAERHDPETIAIALDLDPGTPAVLCDVRNRESVKDVLITLIEHSMSR
jgi:signal recognition particle receptor subunit beta